LTNLADAFMIFMAMFILFLKQQKDTKIIKAKIAKTPAAIFSNILPSIFK
jgi:hypothetical protein